MYDLHTVFSSPNSVPKYSERDVQSMRADLVKKFEKEFELVQLEIQETETKRLEAVQSRSKMESTLSEWEKFMRDLIAQKDHAAATSTLQQTHLQTHLTETQSHFSHLQKEHQDLQSRHRQLRLDLEDAREANHQVSNAREEALEQVKAGVERFDALKGYAEEKLESANIEIARVRAGYEKEIAALKVKLSRTELHMSSLERTVETKAQENAELTKICDDLLMQ
ncbi:Transforming acidic coiled-coil-containing protein 3, partial [Podochytrium sp. JEL0797]